MTAQIICGDCLDVMQGVEAGSVDAIVTDPPYGLSFMAKDWDKGVPGSAYWIEALRVAKPGAHLLAFGGTRTYHRLACAIEDAGWEIRDCLCWLYGSGFPKSHNLEGGLGTGLKPAFEPIIMARKPFKGTVAANVQTHGTGALNIEGCRIGTSADMRSGDFDDSRRTAPKFNGNDYAGGNILQMRNRDGIVPNGRWPANLIHDGSDEVIGLFPMQKSGGTPPHRTSDKFRNSYGAFKGESVESGIGSTSGSASRFFYCAKASRAERNAGLSDVPFERVNDGRSTPIDNPFQRGETLRQNTHPTVKPLTLMQYLCRLVTPPGGLILDPFAGSGTTGVAAILEGMDFIGIERDPGYAEIARKRIDAQQRTPALSTYLEEAEA